jgi:uncharacterized membrane protein
LPIATVLVLALLIGIVCGLRSMTAPAVVCWGAHLGWLDLMGTPLSFMGSVIALVLFTIFAVGELIADKTPKIPRRIDAFPLLVRLVFGGLCGAALAAAGHAGLAVGAVAGAVGGAIGAFAGYHARRALTVEGRLPDLPVALLEDLIAVGGGLLIVSRF